MALSPALFRWCDTLGGSGRSFGQFYFVPWLPSEILVDPHGYHRDGDDDVMLGQSWLRNDGAGVFTEFAVTSSPLTGGPDRNRLADINADGRLDVGAR